MFNVILFRRVGGKKREGLMERHDLGYRKSESLKNSIRNTKQVQEGVWIEVKF